MKGLFKALLSVAVAWVSLGAASAQQEAQPSSLTLQQAVNIALEKSPLRKVAMADTKVASAGVRAARSFLMPHLSFSETATRGDNPAYVFGSKLRQQRFTQPDFTLSKLNTPLPFGNFSTRFGGTWNLFDSFATWHGINQAKQMNEAAGHELDRTDQEIVFRVVSSYYDVLLVAKELEVAEQSAKTAQSIMDRSQAPIDSGLDCRVRSADSEGSHGGATAGSDPREEQSGSGAGTAEHGDGCAARFSVPDYRTVG